MVPPNVIDEHDEDNQDLWHRSIVWQLFSANKRCQTNIKISQDLGGQHCQHLCVCVVLCCGAAASRDIDTNKTIFGFLHLFSSYSFMVSFLRPVPHLKPLASVQQQQQQHLHPQHQLPHHQSLFQLHGN